MEVIDIGVGETDSEKLMEVGILTPADLVRLSASAKAREAIAVRTGIPEPVLLRYRNQADLARVKGLGRSYLMLLQLAGVHSLEKLAGADAEELFAKTGAAAAHSDVKRPPTLRQVAGWIESAKKLPSLLKP